jgi:aspartyl-tRNA(Asn)/glutamyl-tRNA(Gln) amidotransferase subunit A
MSSSATMTMTQLAASIRDGVVRAEDAAAEAVDRMRSLGMLLNCTLAVDDEAALTAGREADLARSRGRPMGPLHGVPLAHKDIFARDGRSVSAGSPVLAARPMPGTATVVARLRAAGAFEVGALHLAEFARSPTGANRHYGPCRNPWNLERVSGGSSSGSAAAVAARIVTAALGTDTGGSIRMPAAMCGVVGLRPTYSQVSRAGVFPLSWSLDAVGPLARTAADCAHLFDLISGTDPLDPVTTTAVESCALAGLSRSIIGLRIALPKRFFFDGVQDSMRKCLDQALAVLVDRGAVIVPIDIPDFDELDVIQDILREVECATVHTSWIRSEPERYADQVRARIEGGFLHLATRYCEALNLRSYWLDVFAEHVFAHADVLFTPTVPVRTPSMNEADDASPEAMAIVRSLGRTTRQTGYVGLPALSVPCGFDPTGMPVGFQLIGRPFGEARLLRIAHAYQQDTDWHERAPDLKASSQSAPVPYFKHKEKAS